MRKVKPSDDEEVSRELSMQGEGKEGQSKGEFEWIGKEKAAEVDATKQLPQC